MPSGFFSNLGPMLRAHEAIGRAAVGGAAQAVVNQAKKNLRGGFKSGDFVTGRLQNSVDRVISKRGLTPHAQVGTVVTYGAFWEFGHHNVFTRKYERKEWLRPAFVETRDEQASFADSHARDEADRQGTLFSGVSLRTSEP